MDSIGAAGVMPHMRSALLVLLIWLSACMAADSNGAKSTLDKCGVPGGDNSTCHIISGIFTRTGLPYGYSKVASIPIGACQVNITELTASRNNYLALKLSDGSFFLNGNWALGYSNDYDAAGTSFKYHHGSLRDPGERIFAKGPIKSSVDIYLLRQSVNRGIFYTYTIPMGKSNKPPSNKSPPEKKLLRKRRRHHQRRHKSTVAESDKTEGHSSTTKRELRYSAQPVKLDDKAPLQLDEPQRDETETGDSDRYKQYLDNLRRQREKQRQLRVEQRRQLREDKQNKEETTEKRGNKKRHRNSQKGQKSNVQYPATGQSQVSAYRQPGSQQSVITPQRALPQPGSSNNYAGYPLSRNNYAGYPANSNNYAGYPVSSNYPAGPNTNYVASPQSNNYPGYPIPSGYNAQAGPGSYNPSLNSYPQPLKTDTSGQAQQVISPYKPGYQQGFPAQSSRGTSMVSFNPSQPNLQAGQQQLPAYLPAQRNVGGAGGAPNPYGGNAGNFRSLGNPGVAPFPNAGPQLGLFNAGSGDYAWKISGFTECSATCGGGNQSTIVVCVKASSQTVVTDANCAAALKPQLQAVTCNNLACPPAWEASPWGACSTSCDPGTQTRSVACKQRLSSALSLNVATNECNTLERPITRQACNRDKRCVDWQIGEWGPCSTECGRGQRSREVVCKTAEGRVTAENRCATARPQAIEICDMGSCAKTWFFTEWSDECSTACGEGVYSRKIHCSAERDRCSALSKPRKKSQCKNDLPCGGKWFTGPWSKCNVPCGEGQMLRDVVCMKKLGRLMAVVSEENCMLGEKPLTQQVCQTVPCVAEWYMTDWTECSRSCNTGFSTREVKCLDPVQRPSTLCLEDKKPATQQTCNTYRCPASASPSDQGCSDKLQNCRVILQARLCRFDYYKDNCCFSCRNS